MYRAGHIARVREKRNAYRVVVGKPQRHRPLGRLRHKWENSIQVDLKEQDERAPGSV